MPPQLEGKRALVCGASRGLGFAAAEALAAAGAQVFLVARQPDPLAAAVTRLQAGARVPPVALPADLTSAEDVAQLADLVESRFGTPHVLVVNGGGPPAGPFLAFDDEAWRRAGELLLLPAVRLVRRFLPGLTAQGYGRVVAVTSIAARQPLDGLVLSNAYRAAVHGLFKTLARQYAGAGVTFNCVMPGYTDTERIDELAHQLARQRGVTPADIRAQWQADIPAGRLGRPADFGELVAFLASDAAGYITGAAIPIDGGFSGGLF